MATVHKVVVVVRDGLLAMELGTVHRLFGQARSAAGEALYDVVTCTPEPGDVRTDTDVCIRVTRGPDALADADTVIVPASDLDYDAPTQERAEFFDHVRPDARIASICTGSFALAAAGLLDGKRATTHWKSADSFRSAFPRVDLDPHVLYTHDGRILTAAGEASGIDLCLYIIRQDFGSAVANEVARGTVVPPHRSGGQAQFATAAVSRSSGASMAAVQEWALANLHRPMGVDVLAARRSMSVRTFTRRFTAEVGVSPAKWVTAQRVHRARELLESTDLSIDIVAERAGFGTATSMRQHLAAAIGVSPSSYRATFRR